MRSSIFIPKTINVGYQNRSGTYTGKLAYVIYYDEKGKLRKETSWNGWRDKNIPNNEYDNIPTEGFVLNKKAGDYSTGWDHRHAYCRVYDPRGFEFEITIENLLYILENANCIKGKGLEGEFVYGWGGKDLVLMPVESPDYKEIREFNKIVHNNESIKNKDLILGATYLTKDNENWIYMGRFETYGSGYVWGENGETKSCKSYKDIPKVLTRYGYTTTKDYKFIDNFPYGKMHWFARLDDEEYKFEQVKSVPKNKLISCVDKKCTDKYSYIYNQMESSYKFSQIDNSKDEIHSMTFEQLYQKATRTYYDGEHKYVDVELMANVNGKYIKYRISTPYYGEENGKYIVYECSRTDLYYGGIEELNIFPTMKKLVKSTCYPYNEKEELHMIPVSLEMIYEKLKPVYLQKYLANGREYEKEYIFNE